jgi:hypothetical protein
MPTEVRTGSRQRMARFALESPRPIASDELTRVQLRPVGEHIAGIEAGGDCIAFRHAGWFEVLLTVEWDPNFRSGHRFSHTAIPDSHPLHSEAIDAGVLGALSNGKQLLRGNTIFDPETSANSIALEVWQDSGDIIEIRNASLEIRRLDALGSNR